MIDMSAGYYTAAPMGLGTSIKKRRSPMRELTDKEIDQVFGGAQPNQNAGGGPGNSGPGDKNSPVQGPPPGKDNRDPFRR